MKKILGISLVAVLAAMPTLANAARTVTPASIKTPNDAANSPLATASYVKGAYNANAQKINALITDTEVTTAGVYIDSGETVAHNLAELDSGLNTAQTTASSAWSALSGENGISTRLTAVEGVASGAVSAASAAQTTASSAWNAIQDGTTGLAAAHNAAATAQAAAEAAQATADSAWNAIGDEGGITDRLTAVEGVASGAVSAAAAAQTTADSAWNAIDNEGGISDRLTAVEGVAAAAATSAALSAEVQRATGAESALSERIDAINTAQTTYATQAGVIATLNSATISVVSDWSTDTPTNAALITPNGYKTGE